MMATDSRPAPPPVPPARGRVRAALEFDIGGDLRYLSHQDELRLLTRALVRARWPLSYSQGFNPRPRLTILLPRNVGTAADGQLALVALDSTADAADLQARLAAQFPAGCVLRRVQVPAPRRTPQPVRVVYEIDLPPSAPDLDGRVAELLARGAIPVARDVGPHKAPRAVDIRPHLEHVTLDGARLRVELRMLDRRTARPSEIITELGLPAAECVHRTRRVAVQWYWAPDGPEEAAAQERTELGYEEDNPQEN
jgi:radical SAM-linked protein